MLTNITGTTGNDFLFFEGQIQQFTQLLVNPYTGFSIFVDEEKNVNTATYDGLDGTDTMFMTNVGDVLFIADANNIQLIQNVERIIAGDGGDVIALASNDFTLNNITINGGLADDILWSNDGDDSLIGLGGNDNLDGGAGNDSLSGGDDNDYINGGLGADNLLGGSGDDVLNYTIDSLWPGGLTPADLGSTSPLASNVGFLNNSRSFDTFNGGEGYDTLIMTDSNDVLFLNDTLSDAHPDNVNGDRLIDVEQINAGAGNDLIDLTNGTYGDIVINGGEGNDNLWSSDGNDTLNGDGGNDTILAAGGNDIIDGGAGNDLLEGGSGNDQINGGDDGDTIRGDAGLDIIHGDGGNDKIYGGADNDQVSGGADNDRVYGDDGDDTVHGDDGDDRVYGGNDNDTVYGDAGLDMVHGDAGNDMVHGGADNDRVYGDDGNDQVFGDAGNDMVHGGADNDFVSGGAGNDRVYGDDGDDTVHGDDGLDMVYGGAGQDTVHGGADNDRVYGGDDDDIVHGDSGADMVHGDAGNDIVDGGADNDRVYGDDGDDTVHGGTGNDMVYGDAGMDIVDGGEGNDRVHGGDDNDTVRGGEGNDRVYGDDGDDIVEGNAGSDILHGGLGEDTLLGGTENDQLYGNEGNDILNGGDNNDLLMGNEGNDRLEGGSGNDILYGGNNDLPIIFDKDFADDIVFPSLIEGVNIKNLKPPGDPSLGVDNNNLSINFDATASITFRKGFAGYNNTLGVYRVAEDGTIEAARVLWENVKDAGRDITHQIDLPTLENGADLGFFILANGDRRNKGYNGLDTEIEGNIQFVYNLGQADERTATIHDDGKDISVVYNDGSTIQVLRGPAYHTTPRGGSSMLNDDNEMHVVTGLTEEGSSETLRIGFEDLPRLGDADYEDVLFDLNINEVQIDTSEQGNDILIGGAGDDMLYGEGGDDILVVGEGLDQIFGGSGADQILFDMIDAAIDQIHGFETGENGDVLNLTDILEGYDPLNDMIDNFVRFTDNGDNTDISVNADGDQGGAFTTIASIQGGLEGASAADLLDSGNLVVDQSITV